MISRLTNLGLAVIVALAVVQLCGTAGADAITVSQTTVNDFTMTVSYLATYQITAQGTNVTVDTYDVSATCNDMNMLGYEFDIGNGNLNGTPSTDSPFQVCTVIGTKLTQKLTVSDDTAGTYLSTDDNTYYADTHYMTDTDTSAWNAETNNACYSAGTTRNSYDIGVGYLDFAGLDYVWDATSDTMDIANVGIVRGTSVTADLLCANIVGDDSDFLSYTFPSSPPAVPEPSSLLLMAAGLAGLLAYAWRKRG